MTVAPTTPCTVAEWRELLLGKTPDQVVELMGAPKDTYPLSDDGATWWQYPVKVDHPDGKRTEHPIALKFLRNQVLSIIF